MPRPITRRNSREMNTIDGQDGYFKCPCCNQWLFIDRFYPRDFKLYYYQEVEDEVIWYNTPHTKCKICFQPKHSEAKCKWLQLDIAGLLNGPVSVEESNPNSTIQTPPI